MVNIYDMLVIGGGPGGLSAGIYGSRSRLKTAVIEKGRSGGQAATTEELENYPGFFEGSKGPELMEKFTAHARYFGTEIIRGNIVDLELDGEVKKVVTSNGDQYFGRTVVLAPGSEPRTLHIRGEGRLRGKGVSYCATCDADFFEDLEVAVVGNGDAAIEEAIYLTRFAREVSVIVIHDEGKLDCNKASAEMAFKNQKLKWIWNSVVEEILGDELVEKIIIKNIKSGELFEKKTDGVFFFVGTVPKTEFLADIVELDEQGYIITNDLMETNIAGVYAVGDAREKYLRQVITAASDGAIAAVAAEKYLAEMESFREQVLEQNGLVALLFWAPQVEESIAAINKLEAAVQGSFIKIAKLDTYRSRKIAGLYNVKIIPTLLLFRNGVVYGRLEGEFSEAEIKALFEKEG